jgi:signal transduction histidine kinase
VRFSFVASMRSQVSARLDTLLVAGARSTRLRDGRVSVKENVSETALLSEGQGLQWFDALGKLIGDEGLVASQPLTHGSTDLFFQISRSHLLRTRSAPILNPKTRTLVGWVRASQDVTATRTQEWRLDEILIVGGFLSLLVSMLGARFLQVRSAHPIRASYERLREFSADASHELRGPITAVKSNAEAALRDAIGMRGIDHERFFVISQAAQHMARLTNDLLLLARAQEPMERDLFAIDLADAITKLVRLYRPAFEEKGIKLTSSVVPDATMYGNPDQIDRIFTNLIENALNYTPAGGEVVIHEVRQRDSVSVRVLDSGIGIPQEHIEKIFERFWRAEAARTRSTGTGLGLPIARALARRHGGDLFASSRPGRGTEFVVTFPYRPPA